MVAFVLLPVNSSAYLLGNKPGCQAFGHSCGEPTVYCQKRPVFYGSCQGSPSFLHLYISAQSLFSAIMQRLSACSQIQSPKDTPPGRLFAYASQQATSYSNTCMYACGSFSVCLLHSRHRIVWHMVLFPV